MTDLLARFLDRVRSYIRPAQRHHHAEYESYFEAFVPHPPRSVEEDEQALQGVLDAAQRNLAAINRLAASANLPQVRLPRRDENDE